MDTSVLISALQATNSPNNDQRNAAEKYLASVRALICSHPLTLSECCHCRFLSLPSFHCCWSYFTKELETSIRSRSRLLMLLGCRHRSQESLPKCLQQWKQWWHRHSRCWQGRHQGEHHQSMKRILILIHRSFAARQITLLFSWLAVWFVRLPRYDELSALHR